MRYQGRQRDRCQPRDEGVQPIPPPGHAIGIKPQKQRIQLVVVVVVMMGAGEDLPRRIRAAGELPGPYFIEPELGAQARQAQRRRQREDAEQQDGEEPVPLWERRDGFQSRRGHRTPGEVSKRSRTRCRQHNSRRRSERVPPVRGFSEISRKIREFRHDDLTTAPMRSTFLSRAVRRMPAAAVERDAAAVDNPQ